MRIKKGDRVVVISGKDKGAEGVVLRTEPKKNRLFVEKVAVRRQHNKPTQSNPDGGILEIEGAIHISNVMLVEGTGDKAIKSRIGYRTNDEGIKVRYMKKNDKVIK